MNANRRHGRAGLTLMEILFVIGILAIALVVEARLFRSSIRAMEQAPLTQQAHARLDQALDTLRDDVWNASAINVSDPSSITLTHADGSSTQWQLTDSGATRRPTSRPASDGPAGETRTFAFSPALHARSEGPSLVLSAGDGQGGEARLLSQVLLSKRGRQ